MRLGTRLILAFLAVALIPAGAILTLTWSTVEARFEDEYQERVQGVAAGLRSELDRIGQRLAGKVEALLASDEVRRIQLEMALGRLDRRALIDSAGKWMQAWDLDLLTVMDGQGVVLSCGHLRARYGSRDQDMLRLATGERLTPQVHQVQLLREGVIRPHLAVVVGSSKSLQSDNGSNDIALVAGRVLDEGFVAQLETLSGAAVGVVDGEDRLVVAGPRLRREAGGERLPTAAGSRWRRLPLQTGASMDGKLQLVAWVARDRLEASQRRILYGAAGAALVGVIISWLLGLLLSRRITRPVTALVEGARQVSTGNLAHRVPGTYSVEMGELVRTFNAMVSDLASYQRRLVRAERVAAWREIARRIAHEIKNPLSPIQVSIETMRKTYAADHPDFPEIFEESTRAILEEVAALKRIVTEFSDFARLPKPTPQIQQLNPVVESAVHLFRNQADGVSLVFEPAPDLPAVDIDREQIGQVLTNLLNNALQAVGEGGQVRVSTARHGEFVSLRVEDDGDGMSAEVLARVFTPYFTTRQGGTGLGLAIVQRIVEDHDGSIEIESNPGRGTTVTILLPARQG